MEEVFSKKGERDVEKSQQDLSYLLSYAFFCSDAQKRLAARENS
jgi:hypothetical protein